MSKQQDLWAFWKYDTFPGFLSGRVTSFSEDGRLATVEGYGNDRFAFFAILPGKRGEEMHQLGKALSLRMSEEERQAREAVSTAARDILEAQGFPLPPQARLWKTTKGERSERAKVIRELIEKAAEVRAG